MKKRIRTDRLRSGILVSVLIVLVGFGTWISCSKDASVSSIDPQPRATKPAVVSEPVDFHPQTGVNYDPFNGMNEEDRKNAIGGREAAEKYLRVIVAHLARAMHNEQARHILHKVVPKVDNGEIHLAQIAAEYPDLLGVLSNGFKDAVDAKNPGGALHLKTQNTESNGEAILKVSKALFDLVLTLVVPDGEGWDTTQKIPVFYMPLDDESVTTVMNGIDANLAPVTLSFPDPKISYPFLLVNFDESSPMIDGNANAIKVSMVPTEDLGIWDSILSGFNRFSGFSLVSPVYAHTVSVSHGPHYYLIQPVKEIKIYNDHEGIGSPEIMMTVHILVKDYPNTNEDWIWEEGPYDLEDVDEVGVVYTDYEDITTDHGTAQNPNGHYIALIRIYEQDGVWNEDDEVCRWSDVQIVTVGSTRRLTRSQGDNGYSKDADLRIKKID